MVLKSLILMTLLCLSSSALASYNEVIASTQSLAQIVAEDDQDVNDIESISGILAAQKIPDGIQNLGSQIEQIVSGNQGTAASSNRATEDQLTDAYSDFTELLQKYLDDLIEKKEILTLLLQQKAIYSALQNLAPAFSDYNLFVQSLLGDQDHKDAASESASSDFAAIFEAENEYEVAT
ncbi:MAG: hypothetical protein Q9191_003245 [Dirinaria sp. TL-2023a]